MRRILSGPHRASKPGHDRRELEPFSDTLPLDHNVPVRLGPSSPKRWELCQNELREGIGTLEERLSGHGIYLLDQIVWETATGKRIRYPYWVQSQKDRLNELFDRLINNRDLGISRPDPRRNLALRNKPSGTRNMFLTADEAFDIYAAHVAHVFYLEATRALPWSVLGLPSVELEELLSSDRYHSRIVPSSLATASDPYYPSHIRPDRDFQLPYRVNLTHGVGLVCDPRDGYRFLHGDNSTTHQNLIGSNERETMENLTFWCASNVAHGGSAEDLTVDHMVSHNFLRDRLSAEHRVFTRSDGTVSDEFTMVIAPHGCHSASNLLHDLAHSVNIPLLNVTSTDYGRGLHQGLMYHWGRDARMLYSADDIFAEGFNAFFPIVDDREGTDREAKQLFFEVHWSPLSTLESWGFSNSNDYSLVPNPDPSGAGRADDNPDLGVVGTKWPDLADWHAFLLEKRYQLCGWQYYIELYCRNSATFESTLSRDMSPRSRPFEQLGGRASACTRIYGGCPQLTRRYKNFLNSRGSNTWTSHL